jgi:hypothetical protein
MPYQPSPRSPGDLSVRREEWELLVRLPGRVVVAATLAPQGAAEPSLIGGLAGLDAIAAGRSSVSRLVRDVVAAIYLECDDRPPVEQPRDPATAIGEVLIACRSAAAMLAERVRRPDADAYQNWLLSIAARVCHAGGRLPWPPAAVPVDEGQRRFLTALGDALGGPAVPDG